MNDNQPEIWLPVPGYEGMYSVSNRGRVRSEARTVIRKNGWPYKVREKFLQPTVDTRGYCAIALSRSDRGKPFRINVLMLEAFVGPRPPAHEACHRNGMKTDNRIENLYWGTKRENALDTVAHGGNHLANRTHCKWGHEFTPDNIYRAPSKPAHHRECLRCIRLRELRRTEPEHLNRAA